MREQHLILAGILLGVTMGILSATGLRAEPGVPEAPEVTVCGPLRERLAFWSWSQAAGSADPSRIQGLAGLEPVTHRTRDGRTLRGYRLASRHPAGLVHRTVLVAGGNAMLADQILPAFTPLAEAGLELVVLDYRGYGASAGRPRLLAIIGDHLELAQRFAAEGAAPLAFYGISMGGIVLTNVLPYLHEAERPERFVIDGSPARVSPFGCPEMLDPVANLPEAVPGVMFVGGDADSVVPLRQSQELIEAVRDKGGRVEVHPEFAHPFMDRDPAVHRRRLALIRDFLAGD
jgi:alpha-beta hydrolase superfamily lysophospholipase